MQLTACSFMCVYVYIYISHKCDFSVKKIDLQEEEEKKMQIYFLLFLLLFRVHDKRQVTMSQFD